MDDIVKNTLHEAFIFKILHVSENSLEENHFCRGQNKVIWSIYKMYMAYVWVNYIFLTDLFLKLVLRRKKYPALLRAYRNSNGKSQDSDRKKTRTTVKQHMRFWKAPTQNSTTLRLDEDLCSNVELVYAKHREAQTTR